ncbi:PBSX family phage terminase large subunit [Hoeflea prorocentri]|uniref:PBSX family phage terminase large subunit n=1 Tax=Hoeflea prorocentri TaxID=1922333 RepID=A0A9X3UHM9_9HYPH|nr:PBSX family phage terminase large subunit [Hoeflea prorocentri]MCY6380995.1 PBSX family phage terminase large subunit [Hoeflea prorocentri]MDA5398795.1 PBSX family phage terminase large subunit [Hoeflea prorocentri]
MDIQFPDVFRPLVAPARFKGAWGGRGSGKSHFFGGLLCLRALRQRTRAVCLREVQNSIKDSVKQLLEDKISAYGLTSHFDITDTQIRGPNDSLFTFRGLKNHNAASIKSLEGFDIAWVEEAQTVSQKSLDLLIPTIRMPDSELWFSWNPERPTDPIDRLLRKEKPSGAIVIRANYSDNPFFPAVLRADMERDRLTDPVKYDHVWLGGYQNVSDMQFITRETIRAAQERSAETSGGPRIMGLDVARFGDDRTVLVLREGHRLNRIWRWSALDLMQTAGRVSEIAAREKPHALFVDGVGVGGGVVDRLRQLGLRVIDVNGGARAGNAARYRNKRAEMWARMRDWLRDVGSIPDDDELAIDLQAPNYGFDAQNRIQIEKKEEMKKRGLISPDCADALALTFAEAVHHERMNAVSAKLEGAGSAYNPLEGW